jgi:hypothetical protein
MLTLRLDVTATSFLSCELKKLDYVAPEQVGRETVHRNAWFTDVDVLERCNIIVTISFQVSLSVVATRT